MKLSLALLAGTAATATAGEADKPLLLTPFIASGDLSGARTASAINNLTVGTTGKPANLGHAGFVTVPSEDSGRVNQIYTWLHPCSDCDSSDPKTPFIVWLQGGPGGPGTFGSFSEIGNYYVAKHDKSDGSPTYTLEERCYTWCASANCLFVDQPTMTGFSFQSYANGTTVANASNVVYTTTSPIAMEQVYRVVVQMFTIFPEYKSAPLYITGESYGGLYTGNLGWVVYNHNKKLESGEETTEVTSSNPIPTKLPINFVGLAVGDPILNSQWQWPTYPDTLYGMGVIMTDERQILRDVMHRGVEALNKWESGHGDCWSAFELWNSVWKDDTGGGLGYFSNFTGSNMTENVLLGAEPDAFDYWSEFLALDGPGHAMHVTGGPTRSKDEGGPVYHTMVRSGDFCANSTWIYSRLFEEAKIDLMIYSSTSDPLLGPPTTEAGVHAMMNYTTEHFGPQLFEAFRAAPKDIWRVEKNDSNIAGYAKCTTNPKGKNRFCYTVVRNAGHETPAFQPRTAYDMFERFRMGRSFSTSGNSPDVPTCAQCSGVPPFTGSALPECVNK